MQEIERPASASSSSQAGDTRPTSGAPRWRSWFNTARPVTLTAAVSPVLVGAAVAAWQGAFHLGLFALTLLAGVLLQAGVNYLNEYWTQSDRYAILRSSHGGIIPSVSFAWSEDRIDVLVTTHMASSIHPSCNVLARVQFAIDRLLKERAEDPEPSWADAIGHGWWARREEACKAKMNYWRAYLP